MKAHHLLAITCLFMLQFLPIRVEALIYSIDDGTGETGVGAIGQQANVIWGNHFNAVAGGEVITNISAAFGVAGYPSLDGTSLTASLWSDPNGDGNPADSVLLTSVNGLVANWGTDTLNNYDITDTLVNGSFFVAISLVDPGGIFPARSDTNGDGTQSLIGLGSSMQDATYRNSDFGWGTYMVRAQGEPAAVPEPGTLTLLGIGVLGLAGTLRRRTQK